MNEMYNMGLSIHSFGTVALLGVILLNIFFLSGAKELQRYKRISSIFLNPLGFTAIGVPIFSGTIMMAAKHLDFTIENIVMIIISIVLIVLEAKRLKILKYLNPQKGNSLDIYKPFGLRILYAEVVITLVISVWMWSIA